ncbi:amidohydrolase family protein [Brevundimonas subvibrioides]|uniref:Amidohydrolase n=1 Tax=Brevundimonas subvibrioides (strain ATCC 15264 / DSM 4735 / LMG 14903 / NBRC 16000 / CB 81) TaxID=633149 RepID=D9QM95_BRESC|nr:amidohydrolase family protein [Brevundimonas subvibrioides]ADL02021.1 amidohydrolase [Brevundimonas subvibrioides ATCC 15264]
MRTGRSMWPTAGPLLVALALVGCASAPPGPVADLAIDNVNVIDTRTGAVAVSRTILIAGERIEAVVPAGSRSLATRRVDGKGAWAIPGLWDAHLHLLQDDAGSALRTAPTLPGYGITHVRDMGSSAAALQAFRAAEPTIEGPVVLASGPTFWAIELPYGDKSQQRLVAPDADMDAQVGQAAALGADFIKVYAGFGPERLEALANAARRTGLPLAGHAQSGLDLDAQARLGLSTIEHLETSTFAGCGVDPDVYFDRIIAARFGGSGETIPDITADFAADLDRPACVAMFERAAAAGLAITPTLEATLLPPSLVRGLAETLPPDQRESCDVYLRGFGDLTPTSETRYLAAGAALLGMIREAGVPLLAGTDAPAFCGTPGPSLARELRLLGEAGLTPLEVLQSATLNPARALGFSDSLGAVAPGREAHVLLLGGNPLDSPAAYARPVGLFTQGRWRDEGDLDRLRLPSSD